MSVAIAPNRIKAGQTDAGVVWKTEALAARRAGADVEAIALPDKDSLRSEVAYVIGALRGSPHREEADAFLGFGSLAEIRKLRI
jgi:ABC-type molybdate transport system substrate-binding protein